MFAITKQCNCTSDKAGTTQGAKFQDKKYGKGKRVHNERKKKGESRCTVCGVVKTV